MDATSTATTGEGLHEGGAGGKFQKRPSRRAPATPYDRPASAVRVSALSRPFEAQAGDGARGGRWLSKLVDPASRIVARGASKLFSSVFRKRLIAPSDDSEKNLKSQEEISNVPHAIQNSPCEVKEQNHIDEKNAGNSHASDGALLKNGSHIDQTFELEQLLKQKTFTRFEFDRLMELLRSRTVGPSTSKTSCSSQEIEKINILDQENIKQKHLIDKKVLQSSILHDKKDKDVPLEPDSDNSFGLHTDNTTVGSLNLVEQADSPAEIAKAYMGYRSLKRFPGSFCAQNQVFEDDKILYHNSPYAKKPFDHAITPRSISLSATPELTKNSYMTPRISGKSATFRMSQSPYFKFPVTAKAGSPLVEKYVLPSSPEWTSNGVIKSDVKQARKRGRSFLDDDSSSFGPVRRLRQKCNMMLPSRYSNSSVKYLSSPLTTRNYKFPNQNPLNLDDQRQAGTEQTDAENNAIASASIVPIPSQSSETARKILEQLDKLNSPRKGKSSKLKIIDKEELPSKLTFDMLHEKALRSMEGIDSSKFLNGYGNNQIEITSDSFHEGLRNSSEQKQANPQENGLLKPSVVVHVTPEAKATKFVRDDESNMKSSELKVSNGSTSAQKKPSFCISVPEDSLDLDDDDYTTKDSLSPTMVEDEQPEFLQGRESTQSRRENLMKVVEAAKVVPSCASVLEIKKDPGMKAFDKPVTPGNNGFLLPITPSLNLMKVVEAAKVVPSCASVLEIKKDPGMKAFDKPVTPGNNGFLLPITPSLSNPPKVLPICTTETMSMLSETSAPVKVESFAFKFGFGLKQAREASSSTVTEDFGGPAGVNSVGSTSTSVTESGDFNSHKGENNLIDGELSKSSGIFLKSSSSSALSTFAVSAASSVINGTPSLLSATKASSVSAMVNSGTGTALDFSTSTTMASSTNSSALSAAFTSQFGSGHPIARTGSATATDNSDSLNTEGGSVKVSALDTSRSIVPGTSDAFSNAGSNTSASMSSSVVSSVTSSSLSPALSFCPSTGTGSSLVSASLAPVSTNSFFTFGASPQSSGLNISFPSTSSQITSKSFGFAAAATSSNKGSESVGNSHVQQSSSSQIGSLASTMFGANGSATSGSSSSLFASASLAVTPPGSGSGITFSSGAVSSSSSANTSFASTAFSSSFGFFSAPSSSSTSFPSTTAFTSSSSSSFSFSTGAGSSSGSNSSSIAASATNSTFNSSSQISSSTIFGSISSSISSPSTGFSLGSSTNSSGSSPFTFGASSVPTFSFGATGSAASSTPLSSQSVFGGPNELSFMNSGSPGNDQMNVEDSMADDPVQAPVNTIPTFGMTFGQHTTASAATPSFVFGSPAVNAVPTTFQFGGKHGTSVPQNPSPFQPSGSSEFTAGGSFSLGSGGGDKSGRKFVRVRRDKFRKK